MTEEEFYKLTGKRPLPPDPEFAARIEAGAKWRAEMEAKIKAMPEPERSKQWER